MKAVHLQFPLTSFLHPVSFCGQFVLQEICVQLFLLDIKFDGGES